ncbi:MAG TPA: MlaD family protein [Solirubrobacteraceae bacterium]|nr:MlaD family protein [Solirubrobacteraceae bacterium]
MRRHRSRISNLAAGLIAVVVIGVVCYLVFGGSVPFGPSSFVLNATFTSQTELHLDSPVRIAGVDVGKVTSINPVKGSPSAATVSMTISSNALPIHSNATADIRPRLFLEGSYYIDVRPGTPSAPTLHSGDTLPAPNTTGPVQLDRVLSALNSNTRANLQTLLRGFGGALDGKPTPAEDATQDPTQRGLTAGQSLNQSLNYAYKAFQASSIVNEALLGQQPNDLSGVVVGVDHTFSGLAASQAHLAHLITSFNQTMGALAARQQDLSETIALLPPTLRAVDSALGPIQASFGPTRQFARALLPSVKQLNPTIVAGFPWIAQSTALFSPPELPNLLASLTPAIQGTSATLTASKALLNGSNELARCFIHNVIPTGNQKISDPPITTGLHVYQELFQSAVGLAGVGQNFDGNGRYVRAAAGGGADRVQTGSLGSSGPLFGNAVLPPLGTRPAFPGKAPPVRDDVPCFKNPQPNLNAAKTGVGP